MVSAPITEKGLGIIDLSDMNIAWQQNGFTVMPIRKRTCGGKWFVLGARVIRATSCKFWKIMGIILFY